MIAVVVFTSTHIVKCVFTLCLHEVHFRAIITSKICRHKDKLCYLQIFSS